MKLFNIGRNTWKKQLKSGKYKTVYTFQLSDKSICYRVAVFKYRWCAYYSDEHEAALAGDVFRISKGDKPINVLRHKEE
jgi:hypothetical protein